MMKVIKIPKFHFLNDSFLPILPKIISLDYNVTECNFLKFLL